MVENIACVNFCKTNSEVGMCNLFNNVIVCRIVEIPPKLIIKVQAIMLNIPLK